MRAGAAADLCILDPDSVAPCPLEIWHDLPGGESRHVKRARGVEWVLVNGEILLERGEATGARPGQLLEGPDLRAPQPTLAPPPHGPIPRPRPL